MDCHSLVHKDQEAADRLQEEKAGLYARYSGTSLLNSSMKQIVEALETLGLPITLTTGWKTQEIRKRAGLTKDHSVDAMCIALTGHCVLAKSISEEYELFQFRRHDRALINNQRERVYRYENEKCAVNRRKRMDQKADSLKEWYDSEKALYGVSEARKHLSVLTVEKSVRRYNNADRILPGTVFLYKGKRYVMTGQLTGGRYLRAYGQGKRISHFQNVH